MNKLLLLVGMLALTANADVSLTLDPAVMDEAKRAVFNGEEALLPTKSVLPEQENAEAALWQQAMDASGTELMPVYLLALLQKLNPDKPMVEHAEAYAEALRLHMLAAAGNKTAKNQLAAALQCGLLPCGLRIICDTAKAASLLP